MSEATQTHRPTPGALTLASLRVGLMGFGGPAGQIALMHRIFVEEKKWIDEARYLHALNYCMLLPGPEAQQLATYVGWLLHGVRGGVIAGALFVLPGALVVLGLSWLYVAHAGTELMAALFFGVRAAVLAFVAEALWKVGKRALRTRFDFTIAVLAFLTLFLLAAPFPLVILAAGFAGLLRPASANAPSVDQSAPSMKPNAPDAAGAALLWGLLWLAPLALAAALLGKRHVVVEVGVLFSQLAVVTFGGAYAVLAYLQQQAVEVHGWLTPTQMIDGLGLAETTPGPLVLVNQFVGYLAGAQTANGGSGLAALCALMATWCTFAPSYMWIFAGGPFAEHLRHSRRAAQVLAGITAAVLGVIASLGLWFAVHTLFRHVFIVRTPWGHDLSLPNLATTDPAALLLSLSAAFALIRLRTPALVVIVACAIAGMAIVALEGAGPTSQ